MPFLFSLAIHDALAEVKEPGEHLFAFLDDVCVVLCLPH